MKQKLANQPSLVRRMILKYIYFPALFTAGLFLAVSVGIVIVLFIQLASWELLQERILNTDFTSLFGKILVGGLLGGVQLMLIFDVIAFLEDKTKSLVSKILVLVIALSTMVFVVNQITEYFKGLGWYD